MKLYSKARVLFFAIALFFPAHLFASSTTNVTQTINAGTLATDIVDGSYVSVSSPSVALGAVAFSFTCQSSSGTLGTASQQIYIANPDAADNGWSLTLAASGGATAVWDSAGTDLDYNDSGGSGCTDGADADSLAGQLTVDASGGTLAVGGCSSCATSNISLGSSAAFVQGTTNSITIATGSAASNDIGDWTIRGVSLSQTIPAEQPAANDYDINLVLTVTAS